MQKSNTMQKPELVSPACFGKSVLLIDPDDLNLILHKLHLKKYKIKLQYSKGLRHALWMVQENPPDLILTEIYFNGQVECEHLYLLRKEKEIPIIVQTFQLAERFEDYCIINGAKGYFSKPLDWKSYLQAIERCLLEKL